MKNASCIMLAVAAAAGTANAQVTSLGASRSMNVSLVLDVPGNDYIVRFDQFEQPAQNATAFMNRGIVVSNDGSIGQQSVTGQSSSLGEPFKLVDASLFGSLTPGEWGRNTNITGQNGLINELYYSVRVTAPISADLTARAYGTMGMGVSMTSNVSVRRNGQTMYTFNYTAPTQAGAFDTSDSQMMTLTPGVWEFFADLNGTGRGGFGGPRNGDMTMTLAITTAIPQPAGALALLAAGTVAMLRRRR
jgi:hypothetical protein